MRRKRKLPSSPSAPAREKGGAFSSHLGPNISGVRGDQHPPEKPVGVQISSVTWERRRSRSLKSDFTGSGMVGFRAAHCPHLQLALSTEKPHAGSSDHSLCGYSAQLNKTIALLPRGPVLPGLSPQGDQPQCRLCHRAQLVKCLGMGVNYPPSF